MIQVTQWMTKRVLSVELNDTIGAARQIMAKHRVNQLPVITDGELLGIVTDRDIRDAYPTSMVINRAEEIDRFANTCTVEEVMTFNVLSVQPETSLETAVKILRRHRIGSLPVIKNGKVVGILTRSDVLDFALSRKSLKQSYRRKSREKVVKIRRS